MSETHYSKIFIRILTWVVLGTMTGCITQFEKAMPTSIQTDSINTNTPTVITIPTSSITPTFVPTSTKGLTPIPSATYNPVETCTEREKSYLQGFLSNGEIIFSELGGYGEPDHLYSLSSSSLGIQPFMEDLDPGLFGYFHVSPDGNWVAFTQERLMDQNYVYDLYLTTSNAAERMTISWDEEIWGGLHGWLADNQSLFISPHYHPSVARKDEVIIFNPFTQQQKRITPSFNYGKHSSLTSGGWGAVGLDVVYDPTMTRVVYLEDEETMILWDTENLQELWRFIEPTLMLREEPTWSPNGSYLAVMDLFSDDIYLDETDEFQILLVNRDGDEVWRSDLLPHYDKWYTSMSSFTWSPDGNYFSYIWSEPDTGEQHLFLLNITTMELLNYCISGTFPVWSPDSQQFIIWEVLPTPSPNGNDVYRNVIVDIEKNRIVQIDDIAIRPVAWILNEP